MFFNSSQYPDFQKGHTIDILIISRYVHYFLEYECTAKQVYIWVHDVVLQSYWQYKILTDASKHLMRNMLPKIDGFVTLCDWHKNHFLNFYELPKEKVFIIGNALDMSLFTSLEPVVRERNRFIYTSAPNRGIDKLVEYFHEIKKTLIDATLHIYRGKDDFDAGFLNELTKYDYIKFHGRVPNKTIIQEFRRSDFWLYPTNFCETYCISALEAQMAGCICICTDLAALKTTVGNRGIILKEQPYTDNYKKEVISTTISIALDDKLKQDIRQRSQEWAAVQTWENRAQEWMTLFKENED